MGKFGDEEYSAGGVSRGMSASEILKQQANSPAWHSQPDTAKSAVSVSLLDQNNQFLADLIANAAAILQRLTAVSHNLLGENTKGSGNSIGKEGPDTVKYPKVHRLSRNLSELGGIVDKITIIVQELEKL